MEAENITSATEAFHAHSENVDVWWSNHLELLIGKRRRKRRKGKNGKREERQGGKDTEERQGKDKGEKKGRKR